MSALVLILWPSSVFFAAVLSFRVGVWMTRDQRPGRHSPEYFERDGDDEASGPEGDALGDEECRLPPSPARGRVGRWWRDDEDTEILPRLQDIRPPVRRTPIRRPRWVMQAQNDDDE